MKWSLVVAALLVGCQSAPRETPSPSDCDLFGRPNRRTGLGPDRCRPECRADGHVVRAHHYTDAEADSLLRFELVDPPDELTSNPYDREAPPAADAAAVCGVLFESPRSARYRLVTYPDAAAALREGAIVTHFGACGLCSTLQDLAVYMRRNDLTAPVERCGLEHLEGRMEGHVRCLLDLGFTLPCAEIWYYNTIHTRHVCREPCFVRIEANYHRPDGTLNACLSCDEERSGPVFKAVAGRTRRNTGLPNAMCRPCSEVHLLDHRYE